jgi:hypothetical protein
MTPLTSGRLSVASSHPLTSGRLSVASSHPLISGRLSVASSHVYRYVHVNQHERLPK